MNKLVKNLLKPNKLIQAILKNIQLRNFCVGNQIKQEKKEKKVDWSILFKEEFHFEIKNKAIKKNKAKKIVFDLNNVLVSYQSEQLKPYMNDLKLIIKNSHWDEYLKGHVTKEIAYENISKEINKPVEFIINILGEARKCMAPIKEGVELVEKFIKNNHTLICLTNCPKEEVILLQRRFEFLNHFDFLLASGDIGYKKPSKEAYTKLLNYCNLLPSEVLFIDDDINNVNAAEAVGIKSIYLENKESYKEIHRILDNFEANEQNNSNEDEKKLLSPYSKNFNDAYNYITKLADLDHHGFYKGIVGLSTNVSNPKLSSCEIFATISVLTLSKQIALSPIGARILSELTKIHNNGKFRFFLDLEVIPYDHDTTSVCLALLMRHNMIDIKTVNNIIDEIIGNYNEKKLFLTYFDKHRVRFCPIVCINILYLLHLAGRETSSEVVVETKKYLLNLLDSSEYSIDGTTYYPNPDIYLLSIAKLVYKFPKDFAEFKPILIKEIRNRIGINTSDSISLGIRSILCSLFDIKNEDEFNSLLKLQLQDGSWKETAIYSTSSGARSQQFCWATRSYNTLLGMKAIEMKMFGKEAFNI